MRVRTSLARRGRRPGTERRPRLDLRRRRGALAGARDGRVGIGELLKSRERHGQRGALFRVSSISDCVSSAVPSARSRSRVSWPCWVIASVLALASFGSAHRCT